MGPMEAFYTQCGVCVKSGAVNKKDFKRLLQNLNAQTRTALSANTIQSNTNN